MEWRGDGKYYVRIGYSVGPLEGHSGQFAYTFVICTLLTALTQVSTSSRCLFFSVLHSTLSVKQMLRGPWSFWQLLFLSFITISI